MTSKIAGLKILYSIKIVLYKNLYCKHPLKNYKEILYNLYYILKVLYINCIVY